ncbi:THAP domain-containing protein 4, partial [Stegodyphus mimosarum]
MVNSCSAYGCKNRNTKGSHLTFHRFPLNNTHLLKLWLYQIKRGTWEPSKYSVICSEHFTEDSFVVKGVQKCRRTLKSDAYPTIFSFANYGEQIKRKGVKGKI